MKHLHGWYLTSTVTKAGWERVTSARHHSWTVIRKLYNYSLYHCVILFVVEPLLYVLYFIPNISNIIYNIFIYTYTYHNITNVYTHEKQHTIIFPTFSRINTWKLSFLRFVIAPTNLYITIVWLRILRVVVFVFTTLPMFFRRYVNYFPVLRYELPK